MQPSPPIIAVVVVMMAVITQLVRSRPLLAIVLWCTADIVLDGYAYEFGSPPSYLRVSHLLLLSLLLGFLVRRGRIAAPGKPEVLIVALIVWLVISACIGGTILRSDASRNIGVLINGFAIPVLILYLVRSIDWPMNELRAGCSVLTLLLVYLIFTAFCERFRFDALVFPNYILDPTMGLHADRARGPVVNAAENGGIIAILLIVALHRARYAFNSFVRGAAPFALLVAGLPALWFTQTRGPWIAFGLGVCLLLFHEPRRGIISALLLVTALAFPIAILLHLNVVPDRTETGDFRLELYRESWTAFKEHPIAGWGLGTFSSVYYLFTSFGPASSLAENIQHDTTVAITTDSGVIGGVLYLSFLVLLFRALSRFRTLSSDAEARDVYTMCIAVLAVFVLNGMFADCRFWMPQNSLTFMIVGAGLKHYGNFTERQSKLLPQHLQSTIASLQRGSH